MVTFEKASLFTKLMNNGNDTSIWWWLGSEIIWSPQLVLTSCSGHKEISEVVRDTYLMEMNASRVIWCVKNMFSLQQGDESLGDYYG